MNWKYIPVVVLAGTILVASTSAANAHGCRHAVTGGCGGYVESCNAPCASAAPCAPAPVVTRKVMVTVYVPEEYEATRTVCRTVTTEEKYTAYKCEMIPVQQKRQVTVYRSVPKTVDRIVTRCEMVSTVEDRVVTRCEMVPTVEERTVTRMVSSTVPVTTTVTRCVDQGGSYQCREVPCQTAAKSGCGSRGLFRHRHHGCDEGCGDCASSCAPATTLVSVYVPNYVTQQVPVTTYKTVCTPVTENVKVTVCRPVQRQETIKVTVCKPVQRQETVKVTITECVPETREEVFTIYQQKMTPYEATRMVCRTVPTVEKFKAVRCVPKTVEQEVVVNTASCDTGCGSCDSCAEGGHRRHGLFGRGR